MKRIVLIGTAVAGLFTAGITTVASAATTKTITKYVTVKETKLVRQTKTVSARSTCKLDLTTVAPNGTTTVVPGTPSGYQYGTSSCTGLSSGATRVSFDTGLSGTITGKVQHWFRGGSLYGTYSLTQNAASGPPTSTSFTASSYSGTVDITGGQGALKTAKGTGTLNCSTSDGAHYTCTEKLKLSQQVTTLAPQTVSVREKVSVKVRS